MSNNLAENLFIITAPSGTGKTTLIKNVIEFAKTNDEKVFMSVSHTTRTPRSNELDGLDYFFISEEEFNVICDDPQFLDDVTLPTWNLIEDTLLKFKNRRT